MNPQSKRKRVLLYSAIVVLALTVGFTRVHILRAVGSFLVREDTLQQAQAIVALAGQTPFRELETAKLYRAGWAPLVIIVRGAQSDEAKALLALRIPAGEGCEVSREVLLRQGVPSSAIMIPRATAGGTLGELQAVAQSLRSRDGAIILVTSKYHARRTQLTWNYVTDSRPRGIVRGATGDPFDPVRWWRERRFVLAVVREYLGLVNYYAGFPVGSGA